MIFIYAAICLLAIGLAPWVFLAWLSYSISSSRNFDCKATYWLVVILILLAAMFLFPSIALGYPENVRGGYPSCAACHVSGVAGGGALTPYGRSTAGSFMSTWYVKGDEHAGFGLWESPSWLSYSANSRYAGINRTTDGRDATVVYIPMQADAELAVRPVRGFTIAAQVGIYGRDRVVQSRSSYAKLEIGEHTAIRVGRFMPYYGIGFPDHTLATRVGLGLSQGFETNNAEVSVYGEPGEVAVTSVWGAKTYIESDAEQGYEILREGPGGGMARAAVYVGERSQIGVSAMRLASFELKREAYGAHALVGFTEHLYFLAEADRLFENGTTTDMGTARLGAETMKGLHLSILGDFLGERKSSGSQIQWFPRAHFELLAQVLRSRSGGLVSDTAIFMFHYYL